MSHPVHADWFYSFVGTECDGQNDRLIVYYKGAYNEAGKALLNRSERNQWEPDSLIEWDGDRLKKTRTVARSCKLPHATYHVRLGPSPGNTNRQGRCGTAVSAWVEVWRRDRLILPRYAMEGDCHPFSEPVTTEIVFASRSEPVFTKLPVDEFVR